MKDKKKRIAIGVLAVSLCLIALVIIMCFVGKDDAQDTPDVPEEAILDPDFRSENDFVGGTLDEFCSYYGSDAPRIRFFDGEDYKRIDCDEYEQDIEPNETLYVEGFILEPSENPDEEDVKTVVASPRELVEQSGAQVKD